MVGTALAAEGETGAQAPHVPHAYLQVNAVVLRVVTGRDDPRVVQVILAAEQPLGFLDLLHREGLLLLEQQLRADRVLLRQQVQPVAGSVQPRGLLGDRGVEDVVDLDVDAAHAGARCIERLRRRDVGCGLPACAAARGCAGLRRGRRPDRVLASGHRDGVGDRRGCGEQHHSEETHIDRMHERETRAARGINRSSFRKIKRDERPLRAPLVRLIPWAASSNYVASRDPPRGIDGATNEAV